MSNYSRKLSSPLWQKKRLEVLNRDDFTCKICGDKETELHVHHLKYKGEPHEADLIDLQTLCSHCHYIEEICKSAKISLSYVIKNNGILIAKVSTGKMLLFSIDNNKDIISYVSISNPNEFIKNFEIIKESEVLNG
jgi:hypothetical protein